MIWAGQSTHLTYIQCTFKIKTVLFGTIVYDNEMFYVALKYIKTVYVNTLLGEGVQQSNTTGGGYKW